MRRDLIDAVALELSLHDHDGVIDRALAQTAIEAVYRYVLERQLTIGDALAAMKREAA